MARKLSAWERASREAERNRARERSAASRTRERAEARAERERERESAERSRAREREAARRERTLERDHARRERERERARKGDDKRRQINAWHAEVDGAEDYLDAITGLHKAPFTLASAEHAYQERLAEHVYAERAFVESPFAEAYVTRDFAAPAPEAMQPFPQTRWGRRVSVVFQLWLAAAIVTSLYTFSQPITPPAGIATLALLACSTPLQAWYRHKLRALYAVEWTRHRAAQAAAEAALHEGFLAEEQERRRAWELRRAEHGRRESHRRELFEAFERLAVQRLRHADALRRATLRAAAAGDERAVSKLVEAALPLRFYLEGCADVTGSLADELDTRWRVQNGRELQLAIVVPGAAIIPERMPEMNPAGDKIKYRKLAAKERAQLHTKAVASYALAHARRMFEVLPALADVAVDAYIMAVTESTGETEPRLVLRARYPRALVGALTFECVDALAVLDRAEHILVPVGAKPGKHTGSWHELAARSDDPVPSTDNERYADAVGQGEELMGPLQDGPVKLPANPWLDPLSKLGFDDPPRRVSAPADGSITALQAACDDALPGARILLAPGHYVGTLELWVPVRLIASEPGVVLAAPASGDPACVVGAPWAVLEGIELVSDSAVTSALSVRGAATLQRCAVRGTLGGVFVWATGSLEASACRLAGRLSGVTCLGRATLRDCDVRGATGVLAGDRAAARVYSTRFLRYEQAAVAASDDACVVLIDCAPELADALQAVDRASVQSIRA